LRCVIFPSENEYEGEERLVADIGVWFVGIRKSKAGGKILRGRRWREAWVACGICGSEGMLGRCISGRKCR
jgi:hypothetical protein